ncbi:MAG: nucleoside triphosphate pyrophosphohydrolase, partial [Kordiimonas sp.]
MTTRYDMNDLLDIMAKLRDPQTGCPWDIEQSFETIAPYTIEEAYEVDDAIRAGDMPALVDELGDLLLQVVFHSQIGKDEGHFEFQDIVNSVSRKMVDRHPHVFGDATVEDADAQIKAWEEQKAAERAKKAKETGDILSALDGVTPGLPSLLRAIKLQNRAARVGFDWPETDQVLDKIQEETSELLEEVKNGSNHDLVKEEFGDLLFVLANLGRHFKLD